MSLFQSEKKQKMPFLGVKKAFEVIFTHIG